MSALLLALSSVAVVRGFGASQGRNRQASSPPASVAGACPIQYLYHQISGKKDPPISSSKNKLKTLSWQERRKLERDRKQKEEDEQTLA
ncbi:hypothetical protein HN51_021754 [Arachis hypogaea]